MIVWILAQGSCSTCSGYKRVAFGEENQHKKKQRSKIREEKGKERELCRTLQAHVRGRGARGRPRRRAPGALILRSCHILPFQPVL